jgi:DNA polymerase-1
MSFLSYPRGGDVNVLEIARKALARVRSQRNGVAEPVLPATVGYDINDGNDQSPPRSSVIPEAVLVTNSADLPMVAMAVSESSQVGVDIETTGLNPRSDRTRLLSLCCDTTDGGTITYLIDCFAVDPAPLWEALASVPVAGHNLLFDLQFLARLGFAPGACRDTMLASQVLHAGERGLKHSLAACCERELGETVAKDEQHSDWSGDLSPEQ